MPLATLWSAPAWRHRSRTLAPLRHMRPMPPGCAVSMEEKAPFGASFLDEAFAKAGTPGPNCSVDLFPQEIMRVLLNLISNGFYATTKRSADLWLGTDPAGEAQSPEPTLRTPTTHSNGVWPSGS